ncbi:aquaporin-8-like isoform X2 [Corticium candelabrum]|uniref:aquaporin-8-like isoform X2 n=1 Tax=Corticium candelabrum TaxID=121492 RepID=UPI002E319DBD|nr:aquaporin-8-like isoform X2 [Corticium candelabrum]
MDRQGSPLIQQPVKRQSINWWAMLIKPCLADGGHLNPAVTLGVFLTGTLAPGVALGFIGAQLLGGITGAGLAKGLVNYTAPNMSSTSALTEPPLHQDDVQAIFAEVVLTTILVLTVLTVAVETKGNNPIAPLAIGMAVAAGIFAGGNVSGASMNPARSFGPAVVFNTWGRVWVYFVGCPLGGIIASIVYRIALTNRSLPIPIVSFFKQQRSGGL